MTRIVFLDRATLAPQITLRRPGFACDWVSHDRTAPEEAQARLAGAQIAITNKVPLRRATLEALPALKLIAMAATGHDCVDTAACRALGITLANIRGYARNTVPEHTFALILALRRGLMPYRDALAAGGWQAAGQFCFFTQPIQDLAGATLVVVGAGAIGQSVARIGRAFGMEVLFAGRKGATETPPGLTPWDMALARADVLTLHCPLTPETAGMIGPAEFAAMKPGALVINTARGGIVDEAALEAALEAGQIAGAGFDVATQEPPPRDSPLMRLMTRPNVVLTPHSAWASDQAQQVLADQLIDVIEAFHRGAPMNVVV